MDDIVDLANAHARRFWESVEGFLRALDEFSSCYTDWNDGLPRIHFRTVLDFNHHVKIRCFQALNLLEDELTPEALNLPALTPEGTLGMDINKATDRKMLDLVLSDLYRKIWDIKTRYHPRTYFPGYPDSACAHCNERQILFIQRDIFQLRQKIFFFKFIASSIN